jgi:hypothetical protein
MPHVQGTCQDCRWWQPVGRQGECRVQPPSIGVDDQWALTGPDDWCSRFAPDDPLYARFYVGRMEPR